MIDAVGATAIMSLHAGPRHLSGVPLQIILALLRTMRPQQWTKNGVIFAGLVFDAQLLRSDSVLRVGAAFGLMCLIAGTIYIINDLVDIEKDRQHPKKRFRPLPSGKLPVPVGIAAAIIIPLIALILALLYSPPLALVLLLYLVLQIAYSFWLKDVVIIDVLAIAAGFLLRVIAGVVVIEVARFSPWLYVCAGFLALFLAIGKRRQELITLGDAAVKVRAVYAFYNLALLDEMLRLVTTATVLGYTLYTFSRPEHSALLITIPFLVYAIFRYLYLIHVQGKGSAPDEVLLEDRPLQVTIVLWGLTVLAVLYLAPF